MRVRRQIPTVTTAIVLLALAVQSLAQNNTQGNSQARNSEQPKPFSKIKIDNFGCINENFYRGAQPDEEDFQALSEMGIKTIIDLRSGGRKTAKGQAEAVGLKYIRLPMSDTNEPPDELVQEFLKIASDPANQPIFVHCKGGRHRTGLVTAIYRIERDGWTATDAVKEMKQFDFNYGFGHGDLKDYVVDYYANKEQGKAVGNSTSVGNSKK